MSTEDRCVHHALAAGRTCRVHHCAHGTVHLTMGVLTLRLTLEQLEELSATLRAALQRLSARDEPPSERMLC